ncbi:MAG TPA: hypothetical protein VGD65_17020, partial [Chryseosolibacter sp.]
AKKICHDRPIKAFMENSRVLQDYCGRKEDGSTQQPRCDGELLKQAGSCNGMATCRFCTDGCKLYKQYGLGKVQP